MKFVIGIIIGVVFVAPMIADPHTALEIGKLIAGKVISVGPLVEQIAKEAMH